MYEGTEETLKEKFIQDIFRHTLKNFLISNAFYSTDEYISSKFAG
jgi:hypothetical protein